MTWLGWLNFVVLQWFGVRLGRDALWTRYCIVFPALPLTGWWSDYVPIRHWKLWLPSRSHTMPPAFIRRTENKKESA